MKVQKNFASNSTVKTVGYLFNYAGRKRKVYLQELQGKTDVFYPYPHRYIHSGPRIE